MPLSFPALEFLQCQYRADLLTLVGRWLRQPSEEELREGYHRLLAIAEAYGACRWLVDARRRDNANQQSTPWMTDSFLPLLPQRLGKDVRIAYLFMPKHLHEIEQDAAVPPLTYFNNRPYRIQRFTDEHAAMQWLAASESAALPVLL